METLPASMVDGLVACTQQAIVTALDWVPTSNLVPPLTCARLAAEDMLRKYSWRKPLETLQTCVRLMLAKLIFYVAFILTAILWKRVLIGRFQTGAWDVWDVRSNAWITQFSFCEFLTQRVMNLNGSQWRVVIYRLSGVRAGKRVFLDRDVVLMGARKRMP